MNELLKKRIDQFEKYIDKAIKNNFQKDVEPTQTIDTYSGLLEGYNLALFDLNILSEEEHDENGQYIIEFRKRKLTEHKNKNGKFAK